MSNIEVENVESVVKKLDSIGSKELDKKNIKTFKEAARILQKETKRTLKNNVKGTGRKYYYFTKGGKLKYTSLDKGVRVSAKQKNGLQNANVNIMGDFRLKFFEMGTQRRKTKKGYNRGSITKRNFFSQARNNKESEMFEVLQKGITQNINDLYNK